MPRPQEIAKASPDARPVGADASASSRAVAHSRIAFLEAQLAEQARERTQLIHLVSHELRTPITVIAGFGRLLQQEAHGPLNAEQHRFVAETLAACGRLDAFVGDLLEARADPGATIALDRRERDLHEVIEAPLEALMPMLEERGIKVEMRLHASEPTLCLDARRVEQVVTNLMTNAIRYGRPAGVIRIESRDASGADAPGVEVAVEDDGPGIPSADRERLFAPFVRGPGAGDDGGLGVGLALCRRIIEAHAGRIQVERGELRGARFVFTLPRRRATGEA